MKKLSLEFIAFLQAVGLVIYCSLIGTFMLKANSLFGPVPNIIGPVLFLMIFMVSAVICALIYLGYPFIIFWEHKQTKKALSLVAYTTAWLATFMLAALFLLFISYNL